MPSKTPIRVRGKRTGVPAEKWHAGRARTTKRDHSPHAPGSDTKSAVSSVTASIAPPTKRRRRARELSKLELLPTEILLLIFEHSATLNLPFASPSLLTQLSSKHAYMRLTSRLLGPILDPQHGFAHTEEGRAHRSAGFVCPSHSKCERSQASDADLVVATRLLNSRFVTASFFAEWLKEEVQSRDHEMHLLRDTLDGVEESLHDQVRWQHLGPPLGLLPPGKLLRAPFTPPKLHLLSIFCEGPSSCQGIAGLSADFLAALYEGLTQAIEQRCCLAITLMLRCGARPDNAILRKAVIEAGFGQDVILDLVEAANLVHSALGRVRGAERAGSTHADSPVNSVEAMDWLDPALWGWAEAEQGRNDTAAWLLQFLKQRCWALGRTDPMRAVEEADESSVAEAVE